MQSMTWDELASWYVRHQKDGKHEIGRRTITKEIDNPARVGPDGQVDYSQPEKITQTLVEITGGDGSTITVREVPAPVGSLDPATGEYPNPSYEVHEFKDATSKPGTDAKPPEDRPNYDTGYMEVWNPKTQKWEQTQRPVTAATKPPAERSPAVSAPPNQQFIVERDPGTGSLKATRNPNFKGAPADRPQIVHIGGGKFARVTPDGQVELAADLSESKDESQVIQLQGGELARVHKDGRVDTLRPGREETVTVDGRPHAVVRDKDGKATGLRPLEVEGETFGEPEGAPTLETTPGGVVKGLEAYITWLADQVRAGKIKPADAARLRDQRVALAQAAINEQKEVRSGAEAELRGRIDQRGQDVQLANQRAATGAAIWGQANELGGRLIGRSRSGGQAMLASAELGRRQVERMGGLREIPREQPIVIQSGGTTVTIPASVGGGQAPAPERAPGGSVAPAEDAAPPPETPEFPAVAPVAPASVPPPDAAAFVPASAGGGRPPLDTTFAQTEDLFRSVWADDPRMEEALLRVRNHTLGVLAG